MNSELLEALNTLEKEKGISKDTLLEAIQQSLLQAYKNQYDRTDNVTVTIDPETCDYHILSAKTVVEHVEDPVTEIGQQEAFKINSGAQIGDTVNVEIQSKSFGRIATMNAKNVILQKIREEERKSLYNEYYEKEHEVVTGVVQRYIGRDVSINLGKVDAILKAKEMVKGEKFKPTERVKVYVLEVRDTPRGPKILVSRTHPELVKRLFEEEVAEIRDGVIEIKAIAREAGSRTKIAVYSNEPNVDAVGACVGVNGSRVNAIVDELDGEKIDIINWDENQAYLIENALSPAKVISVLADPDEKQALVIVPDYQLSLAIGKEGQNARLAAHLTQFKIDIKSETQAREEGLFDEYAEDDEDDEDEDYDYDEEDSGREESEEAESGEENSTETSDADSASADAEDMKDDEDTTDTEESDPETGSEDPSDGEKDTPEAEEDSFAADESDTDEAGADSDTEKDSEPET
ncbi:transcription termination factor NusA [Bilifractor sp. HCP3S3_D3]|uniref:transcription termination factor NusA n=1 Tax=Bilifractor sp. HCP3S3_D3 TaxID=3438907 RepID=UPI002A86A10D|nr:transcription termination factor NusA [Bilifractor sp.]